ncbi:hypothetical protein ACR9H4_18295 [Enterobacter hormaechei subsp. hoffmannii]|nr:hypothetical protein [Enterobacter hormaechei]
MLTIISNNFVKFAALISAFGLINGHSGGNSIMFLIEIGMIAMWLQMDYGSIVES